MRIIIRLLALALFASSLSAATNMDWSMVGSAGIVDEGTIAAGNWAFTGTNAHHLIGTAGLVVLRYPVTNTYGSATSTTPPWTTFEIAAIDTGMNCSVQARLIQVDRCSNIETVLATIVSPDGGTAVACSTLPVSGIDFSQHAYYVEVTISRNNLNDHAALQYVALY